MVMPPDLPAGDPLASLVELLTARWGKPAVQPPAGPVTGAAATEVGVVWIVMGRRLRRRAFAWLVDGHNYNVCADAEGSLYRCVGFSGLGRSATLENRDGIWPGPAAIEATAMWVFDA